MRPSLFHSNSRQDSRVIPSDNERTFRIYSIFHAYPIFLLHAYRIWHIIIDSTIGFRSRNDIGNEFWRLRIDAISVIFVISWFDLIVRTNRVKLLFFIMKSMKKNIFLCYLINKTFIILRKILSYKFVVFIFMFLFCVIKVTLKNL